MAGTGTNPDVLNLGRTCTPTKLRNETASESARAFRRYTHLARQTILAAEGNAIHHQHDYIGTEHLLLGDTWVDTEHLLLGILAANSGRAAEALRDAGVTTETALARLKRRG